MGLLAGLFVGLLVGLAVGYRVGASRSQPSRPATPSRASKIDLADLEMRAKVRGAFDLAAVVDRLGKIDSRVRGLGASDSSGRLIELFDATAASCVRAYDLNDAARKLTTRESKDKVLAEQRQLVAEASTAIDAIEHGVDRIQAAAATAGAADDAEALGELNRALDRQLDVARRVDQRMAELEGRAKGDLSHHERYVTGG
ncbi:MAG: hypothetical protein AAGI46_05065 [Planctomycetota bacterium]